MNNNKGCCTASVHCGNVFTYLYQAFGVAFWSVLINLRQMWTQGRKVGACLCILLVAMVIPLQIVWVCVALPLYALFSDQGKIAVRMIPVVYEGLRNQWENPGILG